MNNERSKMSFSGQMTVPRQLRFLGIALVLTLSHSAELRADDDDTPVSRHQRTHTAPRYNSDSKSERRIEVEEVPFSQQERWDDERLGDINLFAIITKREKEELRKRLIDALGDFNYEKWDQMEERVMESMNSFVSKSMQRFVRMKGTKNPKPSELESYRRAVVTFANKVLIDTYDEGVELRIKAYFRRKYEFGNAHFQKHPDDLKFAQHDARANGISDISRWEYVVKRRKAFLSNVLVTTQHYDPEAAHKIMTTQFGAKFEPNTGTYDMTEAIGIIRKKPIEDRKWMKEVLTATFDESIAEILTGETVDYPVTIEGRLYYSPSDVWKGSL